MISGKPYLLVSHWQRTLHCAVRLRFWPLKGPPPIFLPFFHFKSLPRLVLTPAGLNWSKSSHCYSVDLTALTPWDSHTQTHTSFLWQFTLWITVLASSVACSESISTNNSTAVTHTDTINKKLPTRRLKTHEHKHSKTDGTNTWDPHSTFYTCTWTFMCLRSSYRNTGY